MKGKMPPMKFLILLFLIFSLTEHSFSQNNPVGECKATEYNVSSLEWKIWGYRPENWKLDFNFNELKGTKAEYISIPAKVPWSVQKALRDAGIIDDWNIDNNYISIEWIENRHWIFAVKIPDEWISKESNMILRCQGLDDNGVIMVNGKEPLSLEEYVAWSQERQTTGLSIALKANKSRFPECGGFIIWMGHDSYPCPVNTSILDFDGNLKPVAVELRKYGSQTFKINNMRKLKNWFVFMLVIITACNNVDVTRYVDPNIGGVATLLTTKNPTVHRPHSMIRVFPVTKPGLGDRYLSDKIYGFAVNMPAYRMGHVTELMPTSGEVLSGYDINASSYDHDMEEVHPWYHKVLLEDSGITVDWTTTERAVIYRFIFQNKESGNVIFRSRGNASFFVTGNNTIDGWEEFNNTKQYFYAEFSKPFETFGTIAKGDLSAGKKEISGSNIGSYLTFNGPVAKDEVRIGISYIDEKQAKDNLYREMSGKSFDQVLAASYKIWEDALGKIQVTGGTDREKRIFYTSLYRGLERMVNISEYGRYYSGYDNKVHEDKGRAFYVDDWLWDTFRCHHPLLYLLDPEQQVDMVQSYVLMYEQSGWMPSFPQFYGDFPAMIGFHSAALFWDTYQKGGTNFDVEKGY